jgi:hypothetical protein
MAIRQGWKVLEDGRRSCWAKLSEGGIVYPLRRWVKPRKGCGPLAVFADREMARIWAGSASWSSSLTVHRCEYKPSRFRHLWRMLRGRTLDSGLGKTVPLGTRFANAARTLE